MESCMGMGMGWLFVVCWHLLVFHFSFSLSLLCHPHDTFALLQFKTSFTVNSTFYDDPTSWPADLFYKYCVHVDDKTATWENGTDCCSWVGVTCHPISGHVIALDLTCSALQGEIHRNSSLFRLHHLHSLNLAFNNFSNSHFSSRFVAFESLTYLNLSHSHFEGEIPPQISHLSKLQSLDLSLNDQLKWRENTWKRQLQNTTVLRELVLDYTDMTSISMRPPNMSSSLVTLSLQYTGVTGKLTDDFPCLPHLQDLYLGENYFIWEEQQLPNLSCSAASLRILYLSFNSLQGPIPASFSNLTLLTSLHLSWNHNLNGSIPASFSNLTHLTSLDLSTNNLSGSIPSSLLTLPRLTFLNLRENQFTGQIPNVFPESNRFEALGFSLNNFRGELPSTLSNLQHLTYLDLSFNKLSGQIPDVFVGLTKLNTLDLSSNKLEGQIPSSLFDLTQLSYLYFSDNKLEGPLPNKITGSSNVTGLRLDNNFLNGTIPSWCLSLPYLVGLDVSNNQFTGQIPAISSVKVPMLRELDLSNNKLINVTAVPKWLHEMDSLRYLNLSHNLLSTPLDQFLVNSPLVVLDLGFNSLTGGISSSICNATSLEILNLSHNKLTGIIPQCLPNISSLYFLDLQMNKLYGTLPNFSNNEMLRILYLNDNQLGGLLPESLTICTSLQVLNLGNNQIEGTFPHWLQTLSSLEVLVLRANKLHGPVVNLKTEGFPNLVIFDISSNNFSGPIPKVLIQNFQAMKNVFQNEAGLQQQYIGMNEMNVTNKYTNSATVVSLNATTKGINITFNKVPTNLVIIDLSNNKFVGEIPNVIGELHALKGINLFHNMLSGPIPQSIGNLTNLESLDLSSNMLTGKIPTELVNLNFLEFLNVSNNYLEGEIPQGKQFDTFSNDSFEGNLGLCGVPLSMKCREDPEQHSSPSLSFWREEKFGFGWESVAIGYGCGMVFGVGIGYCVLLIGKPQWLARMVGG